MTRAEQMALEYCGGDSPMDGYDAYLAGFHAAIEMAAMESRRFYCYECPNDPAQTNPASIRALATEPAAKGDAT